MICFPPSFAFSRNRRRLQSICPKPHCQAFFLQGGMCSLPKERCRTLLHLTFRNRRSNFALFAEQPAASYRYTCTFFLGWTFPRPGGFISLGPDGGVLLLGTCVCSGHVSPFGRGGVMGLVFAGFPFFSLGPPPPRCSFVAWLDPPVMPEAVQFGLKPIGPCPPPAWIKMRVTGAAGAREGDRGCTGHGPSNRHST